MRFGSVDVSTERKLGWKYKIDQSPLVKLLNTDEIDEKGNWKATDYQGERDSMHVCEFCIKHHRERHIPYTKKLAAYEDEGDVIELNDDNFDEIVYGSNQIWFIEFYAPWCYHCKLMKPAFTLAST